MKEVWQEIKQGIGASTLLLTLLSISLISILVVLLVSNQESRSLTEKRFHIVIPLNQPIQTNFTP